MKVIRIILFLLAFIVISTSATINITYPSSVYYWVSGAENNEVRWTNATTDPQAFAIYLTNPQRPEISKFAIANSVDTIDGLFTVQGITLVGPGFQLIITDALDTAVNYSMSELFEIKPNNTTPIAYVTPTPTPNPSATATASNNDTSASSSPSSTKSSSNSIHNYGSGTLVLITLFIIALF